MVRIGRGKQGEDTLRRRASDCRQLTEKTEFKRGLFAARLARVDLPAALAIAKDFDGERSQGRICGDIALRLIDHNPAEAERMWNQTKGKGRRMPQDPTLAWKMSTVDPSRPGEHVEFSIREVSTPTFFLFVALGSKSRHESSASMRFKSVSERMDRL